MVFERAFQACNRIARLVVAECSFKGAALEVCSTTVSENSKLNQHIVPSTLNNETVIILRYVRTYAC